jgi:hypothetical protein
MPVDRVRPVHPPAPSGTSSDTSAPKQKVPPQIKPAPAAPFSVNSPANHNVPPPPAPAPASHQAQGVGAVNDPLRNPQVDPLFKNLNTPVPPDPITSAHRFAADYLQERHIEGDPDNIYLSAYDPQRAYAERIMSMTEMVLKNRQKELNDNVYGARETSLRDAAGKEIPGLDSSDFQGHIWKSDFAGIYQNQVNDYFAKNTDVLASTLQAGMLKTATQQVHDRSLSIEGAGLVSRGLGVGPYTDWTQLTREQLTQPHKDWGVTMAPLKINDAVSGQAYLFTDQTTGKTVMFLPGNSRPFHQFDNQNQIPDWINNHVVMGSQEAQDQFTSYFPADQTRSLQELYINLLGRPERLRDTDYFDVNHLAGPALPTDYPALHMLDGANSQLQTLGKEMITSDAQWGRQTAAKFLNSAVPLLLPISLVAPELGVVAGVSAGMAQMGLGVYQHNSGRSSEERGGGLNNVAIGFLNAATSVFGGETKLATDVNLPETNGGADSAVSMTPSEIQDRAQPDDHGVYHVDDKQYVIYDGKAYQVHVQSLQPDRAAVIDPETGEETGQIFKRDNGNQWAPETDGGLKGGNDAAAADNQREDQAARKITATFRKHMSDKIHKAMTGEGTFWKGEKFGDVWLHEPIDDVKALSHENIDKLETKLGELNDYEDAFLERFLNEPLYMTHASGEQRGVLLSRKQLEEQGLLTADKEQHTTPTDIRVMATDDHVFFGLEHGYTLQKPHSEFGKVFTRYLFDQPRVTQTGLLQLIDLVAPQFPDPSKYFKEFMTDDTLRGDMNNHLNMHAKGLKGDLPSMVFYGSDMKRGLALSMLDRLRSLFDPDLERNILARSSLNTLINGLFRPQVLVPRVLAGRPKSVHHVP